jgi:hypothetical protein
MGRYSRRDAWFSMRRRNVDLIVVIAVAFGFLFFVPVLGIPQYQAQAQSCDSASLKESTQAEPEPFEPCTAPEFGSVTYSAFGAGGVWMEDEYAHYYVVCVSGQTVCS